jgi:hypothetical protein
MKNIFSFPRPPHDVPCVFRPATVESRKGLDTLDRSVACMHESPVGDDVGAGVGAGVGGGPADHVNVNVPRPEENASTRK